MTPSFAAVAPTLPPLTTVSGSPRLPGKFVWADLVTDDVARAQKFYAGLFGWTFHNLGGYAIAANDERPLCGMFQRAKPADAGAKPRWFGYLSVANVARAEQAVTKAGGKVLAAPKKMPGRGEQAVFADPEGAVFGVLKSSAGDPADFLADPVLKVALVSPASLVLPVGPIRKRCFAASRKRTRTVMEKSARKKLLTG